MNVVRYLVDYIFCKFNGVPQILSIDETIEKIVLEKLSVARFGDGEFDVLLRKNDIGFQKLSDKLGYKLTEVLRSTDKNLLVCIPKVFSEKDLSRMHYKAKRCWVRFLYKKRKEVYSVLDFDKIYGDSLFTRNYIDLKDKTKTDKYFKNIKRLWDKREVVIVEGKYTRFSVGNDLLDNAASVKRILCPPQNAFDKYQIIIDNILKIHKDSLILVALGPTATVLAADLSSLGFQAIDIGHLDIEYEWFMAGVNEKISVCNKWTNETKGMLDEASDTLNDKKYKEQIIVDIS